MSSSLPLSPVEYLAYLRRATAEFEQILRTGDLDAPVVSCGQWRVRDLGAHLGEIHRWAAGIVTTGERPGRQTDGKADDKAGDVLADDYAASAGVLLEALAAADPTDPCWHFLGAGKEKAFWFRRQSHETLIHLVDAVRATGGVAVVDPLFAADGVDEVITAMLPSVTRWYSPPPLPVPLLLRATDTDDSWSLAAAAEGEIPVPAEVTDAVTTVEARAVDLLLLLWKRDTLAETAVRVTGDESAAAGFLTARMTP